MNDIDFFESYDKYTSDLLHEIKKGIGEDDYEEFDVREYSPASKQAKANEKLNPRNSGRILTAAQIPSTNAA